MTDRIPVSSFQKHDAVHSLNCYWAKPWYADFGMGVNCGRRSLKPKRISVPTIWPVMPANQEIPT